MHIKLGTEVVTDMRINVCTEVAAKIVIKAGTEFVTECIVSRVQKL